MGHGTQILNLFTLFVSFCPLFSFTSVPRFQTTRLTSTAGAGAASLSMDEASILNPAPLAFFNISSIYFQKSGGDLLDNERHGGVQAVDQMAFIASDTQNALKGSVSYAKKSYGVARQDQLGVSMASSVGDQSGWGLTYRRTIREDTSGGEEKNYEQFITGILHVINPEFSMGLVLVDPLGEIERERRGIFGIQYVYLDFISLMLDIGADYSAGMSETFTHREAIQIKLFGDVYGRFGVFTDRGLDKDGTGVGLSWVGPRLILDFALANTKFEENLAFDQRDSRETETSFSISYQF